jgi:malate dehydrogenase
MGILSTGAYGVPEGLIYSFPCTCTGGIYSVVESVNVNDFSRAKMDATAQELSEERDAVRHLLG